MKPQKDEMKWCIYNITYRRPLWFIQDTEEFCLGY